MSRRKIFAGVVAVVGLSGQLIPGHPLTAVAMAAPPKSAPESAAADARAHALFRDGDAAYAEGRYEEAHAAFQEAYELSGRPQLLFNISNALERLGRYAEASEALERYLTSGKVKDRAIIQKRLANLSKRVDEQKKEEERAREEEEKRRAAESEVESPTSDEAEAASVSRTTPSPPERPVRVLPIVLLGAGGAALVTAGVFGALTLSARSDVDAGCSPGPSGRLCNADTSAAIDRDKTFGLVADIALVTGAVIGAAGLYLLLAGDDDIASAKVGSGARPTRVEARPAGAGIEIVGTF